MTDKETKDNFRYWSIIPAEVKYNREISDFAKLLYGEINSLRNKLGYCYASNGYLAERFNKTERSVSSAISQLVKWKLVRIEEPNNKGRRIFLLQTLQDFSTDQEESFQPDIEENFQRNNKEYNNKDNTKENIENPLVDLPIEGSSKLLKVVNFYSLLWLNRYGSKPSSFDFGHLGKRLKPILDSHSSYVLALLLLQYFRWHGASGNDESIQNNLNNNFFPLAWLPNYIDAMKVYLKNESGIDIEDEEKVREIVDEKLEELKVN
jgi:hypothetical protein